MGNSLERGLAAGFAGAADIYKSKYLADLQARHAAALEGVRHQYRMQSGAQAGLLAGQQADVEHGRAMEMEGAKAESAMERSTSQDEAAMAREQKRGEFGIEKEKIKAEHAQSKKYKGFGGRYYSFSEIQTAYKTMYPDGWVMEGGKMTQAPDIRDFAKKELGVQDFMVGPPDTATDPGEAGKAAVKQSEAGSAPMGEPKWKRAWE